MKTFAYGGIHPADQKLTADLPLQEVPLPAKIILPVSQHIGAPSEVLVKKGERVKAGQLVAQQNGFISSQIHSSVAGTVTKIDQFYDQSGYRKNAIEITTDGDEWIDLAPIDPHLLTADQIVEKIKEGGIVGNGGASFPTFVKYKIPANKKVENLLVNGVECEPYLTADHRLMLEKGPQIIQTLRLLLAKFNITRALIGIEANKPDAINYLTQLTLNDDNIQVIPLENKYPQGGEKQLIKALIDREIAPGALPLDLNCIVNNVGTFYAIYEQLFNNRPMVQRVVTVSGNTLKRPGNYWVRVGTPMLDLVRFCQVDQESTRKILSGGPMMGKALLDWEIPITKGMSGLLFLSEELAQRPDATPCIRCGQCVEACPFGLEPYLLAKLSEKMEFARMKARDGLDCCECGSCSYICPSHIPLLDYIRSGKMQIKKRAL